MIRSRWIEHEKYSTYIYIQVLLPAFSAEKLIRRAGASNSGNIGREKTKRSQASHK